MLLLVALLVGSTNVWADDSYTQITSINDIDKNATYIIGDITGNTARAFGALSSNRGTILTEGISYSGTTITVASNAENKPVEFTLTKSGNYYLISYGTTKTYLTYSSGTAFSTTTTTPTTNSGKWNIEYNETYSCLLINNAQTNARYILRNGTSAYGPYSNQNLGSYGKATLYKKQTTPAYTITAQSNNNSYGTVSLSGSVITGSPNSGYRYASPAYTVSPENSATVSQDGNAFTVTPSANTTVTINFEAIPTHTLSTAVSPSASGSVELASSTVAEGATTTATASPAAGYKFTSWSITGTGATLSSTSTNPTTVTMGTADATITANFEAVTTYAITWNVNGVNVRTDNVEEDANIDFPTSISGIPTGYELLGWVVEANKIDGTTDTDPSSNFVTEATSTANITYYAVMAVEETSSTDKVFEITNTDFTDNVGGSYASGSFTITHDAKSYTISYYACKQSSMCQLKDQSSPVPYVGIPTLPGNIKKIETTECANASGSGYTGTIHIKSALSRGNADTNDIVKKALSSATSFSIDVTGEHKSFYLVTSAGLRIKDLKVTYTVTITTYKNYCTTVPTATVTLAAACNDGEETPTYYGTYSNDKAFVVPADMTVSTIKVADSKLVVTAYDEGDIVKAGTGVMVSSATSGAHTITLAAGGSEVEGNMLYASGDAGIDADGMAAIVDDCKYYRLTMHGYEAGVNPGVIGYYWGAADGAAFALAANKAFLAVPTALAKEGFSLSFDDENNDDPSGETTAIAGVDAQQNAGTAYNLAGQRVAGDYKGIVIVNGKKYVRK